MYLKTWLAQCPKIHGEENVFQSAAVVAWILRALLSHSVEEYVLAIGGLNPAWDDVHIRKLLRPHCERSGGWRNMFCCIDIVHRRVLCGYSLSMASEI